MSEFTYSNSEFDRYAANYDPALPQGLSISGEDKAYFAQRRIEWVAGCLQSLEIRPKRVMDFGCGTGAATPLLLDVLGSETLVGVDTSGMSVHIAGRCCGSGRAVFRSLMSTILVAMRAWLCNSVFHHIPVADGLAAGMWTTHLVGLVGARV